MPTPKDRMVCQDSGQEKNKCPFRKFHPLIKEEMLIPLSSWKKKRLKELREEINKIKKLNG